MENSAERWASLSEEERKAEVIAGTYSMLQFYAGTGTVTFADEITPLLYPEDINRHCAYSGNLLEVGEDENGPWALIEIVSHKIQMTSEESLLPGSSEFMKSVFSDVTDFPDLLDELEQIRKNNPETGIYLDLPIPTEPQKFYVENMPSCIYSSTPTAK